MPLCLSVEGLAARRGDTLIFRDVSFSAGEGAVVIVTGANGSGKSTLLRIVAGLLRAEAGSIRVAGGDPQRPDAVDTRTETRRDLCHYLGHRNGLKTELTVFDNLAFWRSFATAPSRRHGLEIEAALEEVGLLALADLPVGVLSAGQQRRAALARLLVAWRPIWLLDEPTAALDAASDAMVSRMIARHAASAGIVLAATHLPLDLPQARALAMPGPPRREDVGGDDVVWLDAGQVDGPGAAP
ncbi:heme ABC exporter, ATP-binding protein CcmA [Xaviernesmea oryzae]|uniref:Heme ABC exporter, ATP-binding protein CcmA n=1 Tax=Xaviernesmea oryzae TaxID=464029 RepID=A0A1Q9AXS9_9HYPH|nr:heme ABC exporter ATP-binding protein CcmA [Xaviernesmea oryzae]OLP60225.1 heme ABC exporter, ATP-binding protein CcmA [Xaviernesmea oryzae]SEK27588.1 heme exporter protein A [Xaviernesmea oryzae]